MGVRPFFVERERLKRVATAKCPRCGGLHDFNASEKDGQSVSGTVSCSGTLFWVELRLVKNQPELA